MKRILMFAAVLALATSPAMISNAASSSAPSSNHAAQCKDPKTGKFIKCPPPAAVASSSAHPHCTTGVPCGNTCIAKGKTCHKT